MKMKRSAWDGPRRDSWRALSFYDPHYVDGMPSNEERLRHLDYYTLANDHAPIVRGGNKQGEGKFREDEREWIEEHDTTIDLNIGVHEGIRKVGV